jgi:hypothetical protein
MGAVHTPPRGGIDRRKNGGDAESLHLNDVRGGLRKAGFEIAIVAFAAAVYGGVRALTESSTHTAIANAESIHQLERTLGIAWESATQSLIIASDTLIAVANWIYIWGHWPVIVTAAVLLYLRRPWHYRVLRTAVISSGLIGFLFFFALPTAPPRLVEGLGLVDTVLERSHSYRTLQPSALTNQYAAMPSLHFGWNLLVGIVLFAAFATLAVRVFAVLMPAAMAFAVVATANHYVLDVFVALLVVLVGLAVALRLEGRPPLVTPVTACKETKNTEKPWLD